MSRVHTQGFSLIELILVLGLIGVVALFTVPLTIDSLSRSAVSQERDLFVSLLLRGARAAALANLNEKSHGIQIDNTNHQYILFEGTTYTPGAATNRIIPYTNSTISISGGPKILFEQLSGDVTTGAGTINITNGAKTNTIIIASTGQIDW